MKRLRGLNICETKNCEIIVWELDLEKLNSCGKVVNEQIFIAFTYFFIDFILLYFALLLLYFILLENTFKTHS